MPLRSHRGEAQARLSTKVGVLFDVVMNCNLLLPFLSFLSYFFPFFFYPKSSMKLDLESAYILPDVQEQSKVSHCYWVSIFEEPREVSQVPSCIMFHLIP